MIYGHSLGCTGGDLGLSTTGHSALDVMIHDLGIHRKWRLGIVRDHFAH